MLLFAATGRCAAMPLSLLARDRAFDDLAELDARRWCCIGLELWAASARLETPVRIIAFPLMAACAIGAAARNQRLRIATALASIPTVYSLRSACQ